MLHLAFAAILARTLRRGTLQLRLLNAFLLAFGVEGLFSSTCTCLEAHACVSIHMHVSCNLHGAAQQRCATSPSCRQIAGIQQDPSRLKYLDESHFENWDCSCSRSKTQESTPHDFATGDGQLPDRLSLRHDHAMIWEV
eukprot:g68795.t1